MAEINFLDFVKKKLRLTSTLEGSRGSVYMKQINNSGYWQLIDHECYLHHYYFERVLDVI